MENLSVIDPFDNVPAPTSQVQDNISFASNNQALGNLNTISVGSGTKVMRANQSGFWLGGATFATAPFSVSMSGIITSKSTTIGGGLIQIDGGNKRIIVNDGTYDRVLMGYLAGGF